MKLIRYEQPQLINDLGSWFSDPFVGFGDLARFFEGGARPGAGLSGAASGDRRLATDLYEDEGSYHVRFEVPGVKKADLQVEVEGGVLTVSCEKKSEDNGESTLENQRRAIRLPEGVDSEKIGAKLEDGVLTVTVAKAEEVKPRAIEVS